MTIDPRIKQTLLGSRLEGAKIEGCEIPVLGATFYRLSMVYTVMPRSSKATPVYTSIRLPFTEKVLKATMKWLNEHEGQIIKEVECRKKRPAPKVVKGRKK